MKKVVLITLGILLAPTGNTIAASSDWQDLGGGKARLSAVKDPDSGRIEGLIEVALDEGWKTYWKSPGGSGIAPEFDFSASVDFFPEPVDFPVPEWIVLPDASFYGYKRPIAFPFTADGGPASSIKLDMLIGVCEEICIPATAVFVLEADALNRSDPKVSVQLSLAKGTLPSALADAEPEIANSLELSLNGNEATLSGKALPDAQRYHLVLEARNRWVSDPVKLSEKDGAFTAIFDIPDTIVKSSKVQTWSASFIRHKGDGSVSGVFEADLNLQK